MAQFDPQVIETFASKLYSQANSIIALDTIIGVFVGLAAGYAATKNGSGAILGAIVFGLIGGAVGRNRAFTLKLQAQTVLCQLQIARNTMPKTSSNASEQSAA